MHKRQEHELRKLAKKQSVNNKREEFKKRAEAIRSGKVLTGGDDDWEDVDEHEKDVFDKDGYFDVMESEAAISNSDLQLLQKFKDDDGDSEQKTGGQTLADLIMQ